MIFKGQGDMVYQDHLSPPKLYNTTLSY